MDDFRNDNIEDRVDEDKVKLNGIGNSTKSLSHYDGKSFKSLLPQIAASLIIVGLQISAGMSMTYSGILVPALDNSINNVTENDTELYATTEETAWLASITVIAMPIGSITTGTYTDAWGRLWAVRFSAIPYILGWICIACANNVTWLLIGRFLSGFATPWTNIPTCVYISEISRPDIRGALLVTATTFSSIGMLLCYLQGWFLHWRTVAWLSNIFAVLPVILMFLIPESPSWLISKGRITEAAKSLEWFYRYQPQPHDTGKTCAQLQLEKLVKEHEKKLQTEQDKLGFWGTIKEFTKPTGYKPTLVLTGLFFFQMFSGSYITLFYTVTFLQLIGTSVNPFMSSVVICGIRMIMAFASSYFLKAFSRRSLLIFSSFGMGLFMALSAFATNLIKAGNTSISYLPIIFIIFYVIASMFGMLIIPWTMMSEVYPLKIRGVANSVSYSIGNILMFASIQCFYQLLSWCNGIGGLQWFFAVISFVGCFYTYIFVPETHNKKLDEIIENYKSNGVYILAERKKKRTNRVNGKADVANGKSEDIRLIVR